MVTFPKASLTAVNVSIVPTDIGSELVLVRVNACQAEELPADVLPKLCEVGSTSRPAENT